MQIQTKAAIHLHAQLFPSHVAEVNCNSAHFSSPRASHWLSLLILGRPGRLRWWRQSWTSWGGREWRRLGSGRRPCCCCSDAVLADTGPRTAPLPPQTASRRTRRDTGAIRHHSARSYAFWTGCCWSTEMAAWTSKKPTRINALLHKDDVLLESEDEVKQRSRSHYELLS